MAEKCCEIDPGYGTPWYIGHPCPGCGVSTLNMDTCCWGDSATIYQQAGCNTCCITGCCDTGDYDVDQYGVDYYANFHHHTRHHWCKDGTGFVTHHPEFNPPNCGYTIRIEDEDWVTWDVKMYPPTCDHENIEGYDTKELNGWWYIIESNTIFRGPWGCGGLICEGGFGFFSGKGIPPATPACPDSEYYVFGAPVCPTCF